MRKFGSWFFKFELIIVAAFFINVSYLFLYLKNVLLYQIICLMLTNYVWNLFYDVFTMAGLFVNRHNFCIFPFIRHKRYTIQVEFYNQKVSYHQWQFHSDFQPHRFEKGMSLFFQLLNFKAKRVGQHSQTIGSVQLNSILTKNVF